MILLSIILGSILGFFFAILLSNYQQLVESAKKVNYYLSFTTNNVGHYRPIESYFSSLDFVPLNMEHIKVRESFSYRLYFSNNNAYFSFFLDGVLYKEYSVHKYYWKLFIYLTKKVKI